MNSTLLYGHRVIEHRIDVPLVHDDPRRGTIPLFARELQPKNLTPDTPVVLYLQGGPGFPSPRPTELGGWLAELLSDHRVVLLDQRGTGRSGRIDVQGGVPSAEILTHYRQDSICADAELLRQHLGLQTWSLFGQSFGGFCITHYLSTYPGSVDYAYLTGGLPGINNDADEVYRHTYSALTRRHREFFRRYPWAEKQIREISHHLNNEEEILPTGERLSSRRFRTVGIELGRGTGLENLAYLLEEPFHSRAGKKCLRGDFLEEVGRRTSFHTAPLYAVMHESIYGGVVSGATAWAAARVAESLPGFSENADPTDSSEPFYLYGEHIFPWQFQEDAALQPFASVAEELARKRDWPQLYDAEALAENPAICAAAIYLDDIFVPLELSQRTAAYFRDLRPWISNQYHHNGIAQDGAAIVRRLINLTRNF
ncbi:alpha/beta fold hydrolase [Corynebacterium poyangense]|uniref:Alpha/beta fold hydrolase n=1 Tax=Corynebacterium poyangense TaxID=2684405 RepID=A0A7H0SQ43_9CORY|nr:alpha/beta fold hydrolase [Corynebacterium poyangense]MBZ8178396.1 alpha/beta fold hydrolase [Corynebacterium poyangense]QNQ90668.1 alpha/beta fold hydrolase [Corynebacterium poyangense]